MGNGKVPLLLVWKGEFTLETDQKPLVSIYKKHMIDISPRVQRHLVRSFLYVSFKVVYKKGVDILVADALSRVTPMDPEDNIRLPIIGVNMLITQVLMSTNCQDSFSNRLQHLRERVHCRMNNSQDSKVTITQDSHVRRRTCQQISMNFGHTRKCYPRPPGQGALPPKGKEHCILAQDHL